MQKILRVLSAVAGWTAALLVVGYIAGQKLLPHFDPQIAPPGSEPHALCYGWWMDVGGDYAVTCRQSWLWPIATWMNLSGVFITYTLRFLMMALGRDLGGGTLGAFSFDTFLALGVFAAPTLIVLVFGVLYWIGALQRFSKARATAP